MSAKTSTAQPPGRRTPLSLNASVKQSKPMDKNDNTKKESTNNQKTENLKKDLQPERKPSSDKKQPSSEAKKSSSSDPKKTEEVNKSAKPEDNKKSQNGVNGSNAKDKQNDGGVKIKPDASSNGNTSKKESQKSTDKKESNDTKDKKETKSEDNKNKPVDNKQIEDKTKSANKSKDVPDALVQKMEQEPTKEKKQEVKIVAENKKADEKVAVEHKNTSIVNMDTTTEEKTSENEMKLDSSMTTIPESPLKTKPADAVSLLNTPDKEKNVVEIKKSEENVPKDFDDVDMMEPLKFEEEPLPLTSVFAVSTPAKNMSPKETQILFEEPAKLSPKSEIKPPRAPLSTHTPDRKSCPRTFSSISGRRSIRPIGDYTFSGNLQIRESYRKINTELDFTSSSLNVTVGSEVPNNDSFSFFARSRKRDRSSPNIQSALEVQADLSPKSPKRPRIESGVYGFFNAMASPITLLRARLSRATVNSTPKKLIVDNIEQDIVENVSAIAVESVDEDLTAVEETFNPDSTVADAIDQCDAVPKPTQISVVEDDIKIKETFTPTDSQTKKKCNIM